MYYNSYNPDFYNLTSSELGTGLGAFLTFLFAFIFIYAFFIFIIVSFEIFANWMYFRKCGEGGWKALIPVYNQLTMLKTAGMHWAWIFVLVGAPVLVYIVSYIFGIIEGAYSYDYSYSSAGVSLLFGLFALFIYLIALAACLIVKIGMAINISKKFGKSGGFATLIVFFEPIMLLILGVSRNAVYNPKVKVSQHGIFGRK